MTLILNSHVAREFADADRRHRDTTAARIRRHVAEHVTAERTSNPLQDQYLEKELARKRKIPSIRDLMSQSPEIIFAAKPCWMMSPLAVSQVLPPTAGMFDVVIFDEASQIRPAEAIPALMRAKTAVVAGDSQQLPPSPFFEKAEMSRWAEASDNSHPGGPPVTARCQCAYTDAQV